ncbi:MAG: DEAD/DEAH box helicase, partial [Victivallales bacterium]|nr:DEAD/DEAH box helicase [Victivallales bacterium]
MEKDVKNDVVQDCETNNESPGRVKDEFLGFGLSEKLNEGIRAAGFKTPSEIQSAVIPAIMEGRDVIGQAQTGTGKTAAFCLPAMDQMSFDKGVEMLIVAPTRELAMQVSDEIFRLGRFAGAKTGVVCGGQSYSRQINLVNRGANIITATPGRLIDLLSEGRLNNFNPSIVVLDEADEMLDMGFLDDIKSIFDFLPKERQTLLFSATMPEPIKKLANTILNNPVSIKTTSNTDSTSENVEQLYCVMEEKERQNAIVRLMDDLCPKKAILFCRTRNEVDRLSNSLGGRGFNSKGLHGDMEQSQRNEVMLAFRKSQVDILVATDVASRGLDVLDVTHVFNYHMPFDTKSYIHRVGRTGRASNKGTAITFVTPMEFHQLNRIQKQSGAKIEFALIPSRQELRKNRMFRMIDTVRGKNVVAEGVDMVQLLEEDMDLSEIAYKLASMILEKQGEAGPETIGLDERELKVLRSNPRGGRGGAGGRKRFPRKGKGGSRGG